MNVMLRDQYFKAEVSKKGKKTEIMRFCNVTNNGNITNKIKNANILAHLVL